MRRLILGTAGHIDHGKTTLIRALTGIDTDRLPEEKRRGITIDLGFANLPLPDGSELGIVDVPGHEAFVRNMLAGATGIDLVLLVVAADEGIMPQTREHLAIVELLGVRGGVVAVTKTDLVEPDWLELVLEELRAELAKTVFAQAPIVAVSGTSGVGLDELRDALRRAATEIEERSADDLFRLPVDRVFTVRGTGTVVTGTVWSGGLSKDQAVRVLPQGVAARVRGTQVHGHEVDGVSAGQRAAVALAGVEREQLERGCVLVVDPEWQPTRMLIARLRLIPETPWSIRPRQRLRFHLGTAEVMARAALLEGSELGPGEEGWVQLRLEAPVAARAGDRFVVRSYSPMTTIGGGWIAEPLPAKRKRLTAVERERLTTILTGTVEDAVAARVRGSGWQGIHAARLPIEVPHRPREVHEAVRRLEHTVLLRLGQQLFPAELAAEARALLMEAVSRFHAQDPLRPGIDREELRRALPAQAAPALAEAVLEALLSEGTLQARGGTVARAGFLPTLTPDQARARDQLLAAFESAGLAPPGLDELPQPLRSRSDLWPLLKLLELDDRIVQLANELYIATAALDRAVEALRQHLTGRAGLTPADFKQVLPVSRKFLIPLLEYFDRTGITARRGDERSLRTPAETSVSGPAAGGA
ncbi:MAG: selenocysteine-specific translation elongation factor [Gemmatimonadetes bacterium]|nr:selenocysteine-specific translation elongation factor [Gemmatimonadota bacterium]